MKIFLSLLLTGLIAATAMAQQDSRATSLGNDLASGLAKANFKKIEDAVSPDATIYWIHAKFKNRTGFERYLQGQFSSFDQHSLAFSEDGNAEDDTISTSWGQFVFDYGKSGSSAPSSHFHGRYSAVAQKVNGAWQIVSLHLSLPFPPELPPAIN
jgi:hypothetical protein